MAQTLLGACSIQKNEYQVAVLALVPRTGPSMSAYGPDHHFQEQWFGVETEF